MTVIEVGMWVRDEDGKSGVVIEVNTVGELSSAAIAYPPEVGETGPVYRRFMRRWPDAWTLTAGPWTYLTDKALHLTNPSVRAAGGEFA